MFTDLYATTWHVPDSCATIQAGINSSVTGDTVLVAPGIYYEHKIYLNKDIVVGSYFLTTGDTTYIDSTIIDGGAQDYVFWIDNVLEISGFTIRNGKGNFAGGIYVRMGSPTISHNIITGNQCNGINAQGGGGINICFGHTIIRNNKIIGNHSDKAGGGICVSKYGQATISDNIISNNTAPIGGGIATDISGLGATITGNTITHNEADNGGGIACEDTLGSMIRNNLISDNSANNKGGGIYCRSSKPTIQNNTIHNNWAILGAGLSCYDNASPVIKENNINGNTGILYGAIECTINSNPDITGNIIADNSSNDELINLNNCSPLLRNNTFYNNSCSAVLQYSHADATIINNLFVSNSGTAISGTASNLTISNNDFYNHQGTLFSGSTPSGIGVLSQTNANGDSCDAYANIFLDPLLADTANGDFQLTWANWPVADSTKSPCIDAGDPASPKDTDSTMADIGALYFNQMHPFISSSDSLLDFGKLIIGESSDMALTLLNSGMDTLEITAISNNLPVFSHNWTSGSSHILPGDSLVINVTFAPADTNLIIDTLRIENNDLPLEVHLSGSGETPVGIANPEEMPKMYTLYPAYPNPFNTSTSFEFYLPRKSFVILKVYNNLGEQVSTLIFKELMAGKHKYIWNAGNLANGIYFYKLKAGEYHMVKKIVLVQ